MSIHFVFFLPVFIDPENVHPCHRLLCSLSRVVLALLCILKRNGNEIGRSKGPKLYLANSEVVFF